MLFRSVIKVRYGNLTLKDSNGANSTHYGQWQVNENNKKTYKITTTQPQGTYDTLTGGIITGGRGTLLGYGNDQYYGGGGVLLDASGTFTMEGGNIAGNGNYAVYGAGVCVGGGTMNMTGGTIIDNSTNGGGYGQSGGGVYIKKGAKMTMTGGTISNNNTAVHGAGVYAEGTMDMSDGTISNNNASKDGGGVYVTGKMTMTGGTISNNNAGEDGGGGYVKSTMEMSGGSIRENSAKSGGGVCVGSYSDDKSALNVSGTPVIQNNLNSDTNTANNVDSSSTDSLIVKEALTDGAYIGVAAPEAPAIDYYSNYKKEFASQVTTDYSKYFHSDAEAFFRIDHEDVTTENPPFGSVTTHVIELVPVVGVTLSNTNADHGQYYPKVGDTLSVSVSDSATYSYQWWQVKTNNGSSQKITGATQSTYQVTTGDVGKYIVCFVTNSGNTSTVKTDGSGEVTKYAGSEVTTAALNFENEQVTGVSDTMEYYIDSNAAGTDSKVTTSSGTGTAINIQDSIPAYGEASKYIHIRAKETDTHAAGAWKNLEIAARPQVPAVPTLASKGSAAITVNTASDLQYAIRQGTSGAYGTPQASGTFSGLDRKSVV